MGRGAWIVLAGIGVGSVLVSAGLWWSRDAARPRAELTRPVTEAIVAAEAPAPELAPLPQPRLRAGDERRPRGAAVRVVSGGQGVEHARVLVHGTEPALLTTDDDGRAPLALAPQRTLDLEVTADGYCGLRSEFYWCDEVLVELSPCLVLTGRVLDRTTRQPIAGARVHERREKRWEPISAEALTDDEGRFRIECALRHSEPVLLASAPGHPEGLAAVRADVATDILLDAMPTIEVQVLEYLSRVPIAGAMVTSNGAEGGDGCTDAEGIVHVSGPVDPRLPFRLWASAYDFCDISWVAFPERVPSRLLFELPRPAFFEGRVRVGEDPVAAAQVRFDTDDEDGTGLPPLPEGCSYDLHERSDPVSVESDSTGFYRAGPFLPGAGPFRVRAEHPTAGSVEVLAGRAGIAGSVTPLDLVLQPRSIGPTGVIEGVASFNGSWITSSVRWMDGAHSGACETDVGGDYRLEGVPAGEVELDIDSDAFQHVRDFVEGTRARVTVKAGETTHHDFELTLPFAEIRGHVRHADGTPALGVTVRTIHEASGFRQLDKSGREGRWDELVPDVGWEFVVEVEHGTDRPRVSGVLAGDTQVDFVLPDLGRLPVRVVDAETGRATHDVTLYWRPVGGTFTRARSGQNPLVLELQPGLVDLVVGDTLHRSVRVDGIEVRAGENPTIEVRVERGLDLVIELAAAVPLPDREGVSILLLEDERWDLLRETGEPGALGLTDAGAGSEQDPSFADVWESRELRFDARCARLEGLAPGRYRFKAFPTGITIEPAEVEIPHEGRLVLSWSRGD